ncbi:hypothetical protein BVRB_8g187830 [Beta vulgaris subsp. vulgaris]|nr:hypothetical protein BVRB_8g187830 [Beta vulgaris subsp. vulgaris]
MSIGFTGKVKRSSFIKCTGAKETIGPFKIRGETAPATFSFLPFTHFSTFNCHTTTKLGVVLDLGTYITATCDIAQVDELLSSSEFANIIKILTSKRSQEQVASLGIHLFVLNGHPRIDLTIDGTDEIYPDLNLVTRCGGALLRENVVKAASDKFVVVEDIKLVDGIGGSWFGW